MLPHIVAFLTVALALAAGAERPVKVVLVGDSTVNDEGGWGPGFRASFGPQLQVAQSGAQNGRSSKKSFVTKAVGQGATGETALRADSVWAQRCAGQRAGA